MAQASNTFDAYDSVGIRENLANMISMISRTETPAITLFGEGQATGNRLVEWQKDSLPAAADKSAIEGDVFGGTSLAATTRLKNHCQIVREDLVISGRADASDTAGRKKEMRYQIMKRGAYLKTCMEKTVLTRKARVVGASGTAPQMAGVPAWIVGNSQRGTAPTITSGEVTSSGTVGGTIALSWAWVTKAERQAWEDGGKPSFMPLPAELVGLIAAFLFGSSSPFASAQNNMQGTDRKFRMIGAVHTAIMPLDNRVALVPDKHMPIGSTTDIMLLDPKQIEICFMRTRRYAVLGQGRDGDADRRILLSDFTVKLKDPEANAVVTGIKDDTAVTG